MRRLVLVALSLTAFAVSDLPAQAAPSGRLFLGSELATGAGRLLGPIVGLHLAQRGRTSLEVQLDAAWQLEGDLESIRSCNGCEIDYTPAVAQLTALGIRGILDVTDNIYGVATTSLAHSIWWQPRRERITSGRLGAGAGVVLNRLGDAVELRVDAVAAPHGHETFVVLGYRRVTRRAMAPDDSRASP